MRILLASLILTCNLSFAQRLVPTYSSVSVYLPGNVVADASINGGAFTRIKNLWFDARNNETRGSLLLLNEDTPVTVRSGSTTLMTRTWTAPPEGAVISLPQNGIITQGGSPLAWVVYENETRASIVVRTSYVIIRKCTVNNAPAHGISIENASHDVLIDECDISNWGLPGFDVEGNHGGVGSDGSDVTRIIVQRTKIHDPRGGARGWDTPPDPHHPGGPMGLNFQNSAGNHVFRFNEFYSVSRDHYFGDGLRGGQNFGPETGFPGPDSDIYGNIVSNIMDDAIEVEGDGQNVRIWGNYIDQFFTALGLTPVDVGPTYVFKNVTYRSRRGYQTEDSDQYLRGPFIKSGRGEGRVYVFHNVCLQPTPTVGKTISLGVRGGIMGTGGTVLNHFSRNNIFQGETTNARIFTQGTSPTNSYNWDVIAGRLGDAPVGAEANGEIRTSYVPITYSFDGRYLSAIAAPGSDAAEDVGLGSRKGIGSEVLEVGVNAYKIDRFATVLNPIENAIYRFSVPLLLHLSRDALSVQVTMNGEVWDFTPFLSGNIKIVSVQLFQTRLGDRRRPKTVSIQVTYPNEVRTLPDIHCRTTWIVTE